MSGVVDEHRHGAAGVDLEEVGVEVCALGKVDVLDLNGAVLVAALDNGEAGDLGPSRAGEGIEDCLGQQRLRQHDSRSELLAQIGVHIDVEDRGRSPNEGRQSRAQCRGDLPPTSRWCQATLSPSLEDSRCTRQPSLVKLTRLVRHDCYEYAVGKSKCGRGPAHYNNRFPSRLGHRVPHEKHPLTSHHGPKVCHDFRTSAYHEAMNTSCDCMAHPAQGRLGCRNQAYPVCTSVRRRRQCCGRRRREGCHLRQPERLYTRPSNATASDLRRCRRRYIIDLRSVRSGHFVTTQVAARNSPRSRVASLSYTMMHSCYELTEPENAMGVLIHDK